MATIAENLQRIETAKSDIRTAIIGKGVDVPSGDTIDTYAAKIDSIPSGGTSEPKLYQYGEQEPWMHGYRYLYYVNNSDTEFPIPDGYDGLNSFNINCTKIYNQGQNDKRDSIFRYTTNLNVTENGTYNSKATIYSPYGLFSSVTVNVNTTGWDGKAAVIDETNVIQVITSSASLSFDTEFSMDKYGYVFDSDDYSIWVDNNNIWKLTYPTNDDNRTVTLGTLDFSGKTIHAYIALGLPLDDTSNNKKMNAVISNSDGESISFSAETPYFHDEYCRLNIPNNITNSVAPSARTFKLNYFKYKANNIKNVDGWPNKNAVHGYLVYKDASNLTNLYTNDDFPVTHYDGTAWRTNGSGTLTSSF